MTRIVVAPDKFKGSLTAIEAAAAIRDGLRRACPRADIVEIPVADGGEGTVDAAVAAGYARRLVAVDGPTGERVLAALALRGHDAVVELAEASGLRRLPEGRPAPLTASTTGTGHLLRAALDAGARHIVLGVGGSATTDGGAGMAQALGAHLLDAAGAPIPPGGVGLASLSRIDIGALDPRLATTDIVVAVDVDNPLTGPRGAATVFGPQKGATPSDVAALDRALTRYAAVIERDLGVAVAAIPGSGAAGGTTAGALAFLGARTTPGIELVLDVVGFARALDGADLVITGEGSLDEQSLAGKAPVGVARAAAAVGVPVIALVGRLDVDPARLRAVGIRQAHALLDIEPDTDLARAHAARLLAELTYRVIAGRRPPGSECPLPAADDEHRRGPKLNV